MNLLKCFIFIGGIIISLNIKADDLIKIGGYILPPSFSHALSEGLTVPVYLRYIDDNKSDHTKGTEIANAILVYKDNKLMIQEINLQETSNNTALSPETKKIIQELNEQYFTNSDIINISDFAQLNINLKSFYLDLVVKKDALGVRMQKRNTVLEESTAKNLSTILNYQLGGYYNVNEKFTYSSGYLSFDNLWAYKENHLSVNGSIYGLGGANTNVQIYRAMYEKDVAGRRWAVGLTDIWNLQSLVNLDAINSGKLYGISYGNQSNTVKPTSQQSLIPIVVFLPAAGSVQIFREKRLISIQNLPMGSSEIDTSNFPYGMYSVEVKTFVNGQQIGKSIEKINKVYGRNSSSTEGFIWQVFAGMLHDQKYQNKKEWLDRSNSQDTVNKSWIAGGALKFNLPWWSGASLKTAIYGFDRYIVGESEYNQFIGEKFSFNQQLMMASDSSWKANHTINFNLPKGYGSFWLTDERTVSGKSLDVGQHNNYGYGGTLNFQPLIPKVGSLTFSESIDRKYNSRNKNIEYSQSLYNSRFIDVNVRVGVQESQFDHIVSKDKYAYFQVRLPVRSWFSAGISSRNDALVGDVSLNKSFNDQTIQNVGLSISKNLAFTGTASNELDRNYSITGFTSYGTKYNQGNLSVSGTSLDRFNLNYTSQGSIAWSNNKIAMSKDTQNSGVLIQTGLDKTGSMSALINGQSYTLTGKNNFIALSPYNEYSIELTNSKESKDSVDIIKGRKTQVVLYPGNVYVLKPEIKQMVTVFGRMFDSNGHLAADKVIHNHIGKTKTDHQGEFALDIDKRYPIVSLIEQDGSICNVKLNLKETKGAVWIGDQVCKLKPVSSKSNVFEVRE